jgi:hypothetical protein
VIAVLEVRVLSPYCFVLPGVIAAITLIILRQIITGMLRLFETLLLVWFSFEHMAVLWFSLEPFLILLLRFEYGLWIALL